MAAAPEVVDHDGEIFRWSLVERSSAVVRSSLTPYTSSAPGCSRHGPSNRVALRARPSLAIGVRARLRSELLELIPQWLGTSASENSPLAGAELPTLSVEAVSILHDIMFAKNPDVDFGSAEGVKRNRFRAFYDCLLRWGVPLPPLGPDAVKNFASRDLPRYVPSYTKACRDVRSAVRSEGEERERRLLAVQARRRTDDPLPLIRRALPAAPPASPGTGDAGRHRRGGERLELPSPKTAARAPSLRRSRHDQNSPTIRTRRRGRSRCSVHRYCRVAAPRAPSDSAQRPVSSSDGSTSPRRTSGICAA